MGENVMTRMWCKGATYIFRQIAGARNVLNLPKSPPRTAFRFVSLIHSQKWAGGLCRTKVGTLIQFGEIEDVDTGTRPYRVPGLTSGNASLTVYQQGHLIRRPSPFSNVQSADNTA